MKKIILTALMLSLLLTSCSGGNGNETTGDTNITPDNSIESSVNDGSDDVNEDENNDVEDEDPTLGDEDGDGLIEDEENADGPTAVTKVENAEDALNFIAANVYSLCPDNVPMYTEGIEIPLTETDTIEFMTGLTDTTGINEIIVSQSGVGSIPYCYILLRTDGSDVAGVQERLGNSVNPNKWICVSAEKVSTVSLDNDVVLVMGYSDTVEAIMDATVTAADGVYSEIGSVVNVLG